MILAFDTSSAACTAALFDESGECIAHTDEVIGRGHSERLVPMLAELLDGRRADRIIVGVGPGSFTGIRVGIAAAHGLAIGWHVELAGMSSLALLAGAMEGEGKVAAAVIGGHGELFVQEFALRPVHPTTEIMSLRPDAAAAIVQGQNVLGSGAAELVTARGWGESTDALPSAANTFRLPAALRSLPPKPVYARAPDAREMEAA